MSTESTWEKCKQILAQNQKAGYVASLHSGTIHPGLDVYHIFN